MHPQDIRKSEVILFFAVKYDGRHKARLVADGHLTPETVESIYSEQRFGLKTHKLSGIEIGDKPVLVVVLSWEISIKQQQNILLERLKKLNNQRKFDGTKYKLWT